MPYADFGSWLQWYDEPTESAPEPAAQGPWSGYNGQYGDARWAAINAAHPNDPWGNLEGYLGGSGTGLKDIASLMPTLKQVAADTGLTPDDLRKSSDYYQQNFGEYNPGRTGYWGPQSQLRSVLSFVNEATGKTGIDPEKYLNRSAEAQQQKGYADQQRSEQDQNHSDGLGDLGMVLAIGGLALGFAGALGAFGGAASAGVAEGASLGAADVFTGGVINSAGEVAGLSTLGNTGGALIGTQGIISGTGNAVVDAALNKGLQGAITSAVTGQDPLKGGLAGALSGGFASVIPDMGSAILNNAASGAISGGISAAVNGGDAVTGALAGGAAAGAGTAVKDILPASDVGSTVSNAVAGGVAGGVGSAIAGGDVTTGILKGATSGGVAGAATDLGASPAIAGAAGSVAAGLIDSPTSGGTTVTPAQQTSSTLSGGLGFDIVLPQFQGASRRDMQWGTRLSGGQQ